MLRGGAMLLLGVVAAALLRDYGRIAAARLGAAFALGTAAFALNSAPGFANHAAWWQAPVVALNAGNMCMFWLFARALLDDAFVLRASHLALWSAFAIAGVLNCFVFAPLKLWIAVPTGIALTLATAVFAVSAVARSLSTWRDDLVEGRRRMRMMIVGAAAAYGILLTLVALMHGYDVRPVFSGSANAFGLALLSALIAWRLMFVAGDTLFPLPPGSASAVPARTGRSGPGGPSGADDRDGRRLWFPRPLQSRVQGGHRFDADRIPAHEHGNARIGPAESAIASFGWPKSKIGETGQ